MLTSIGITITVIFNMRLYYKDEPTEVGRVWDKVMSCLSKRKSSEKYAASRERYTNVHDQHHAQHGDSDNTLDGWNSIQDKNDKPTDNCSNVHRVFVMYQRTDESSDRSEQANDRRLNDGISIETRSNSRKSEVKFTWQEVSQLVDKIGFVVSALLQIINYVVCVLNALLNI